VSRDAILPAWEFPRATPLPVMVSVARETIAVAPDELRPHLHLRPVSSTGDTMTVQVVKGRAPVVPNALLYVRGRGAFRLLRREVWPGERVRLTLAAWPRLGSSWLVGE
jgi:hypothetical protein